MNIAARLMLFLAAGLACVSAPAFDLQGHRGARGLEPENTLAAFERALAIGVTTLEMDAAITSDGVVVVSHDPSLNPAITRDAQGHWIKDAGRLIKTMTYAELERFDVGRIDPSSPYAKSFPLQTPRDGQRRPRLSDVFSLVKQLGAEHVRFDIETKVFPARPDDTLPPEEFVSRLLAEIRAAGMTRRVMIQSFDWRTLQIVHKLDPNIDTVYLTVRSRNLDTLDNGVWTAGLLPKDYPSAAHMVKSLGGTTWSPAFQNLDAAAVKTAQGLGLKVIPWTVNETADIERLIDWGVDGLISDYPDRVREVMARRGMAVPPAVKRP